MLLARFRPVAAIATLSILISTPILATPQTFTEDFTTTIYKDSPNTTADWNTAEGELRLFPYLPTLVGTCDTGDAYVVAIAGDHAYVADNADGLRVIDMSDPTNPTPVGSYSALYVRDIAVAGDHAFLAKNSTMLVCDISDPANPTLAGSCAGLSVGADDIAVSGDYAYLASYLGSLQVVDISDPANPTLAATWTTTGDPEDVAVAGDHAYLAEYYVGLLVIDISDPTSPTLVGSCATPGHAYGVTVAGDHAYVADSNEGLQVIDISDPTDPVLVGSCDTPGPVVGVTVSGDRAYVADGYNGLHVVDIHDPGQPWIMVTYETSSRLYAPAISGNHAFAPARDDGIEVVKISDPILPIPAGSCSTPGLAIGVAVSGGHAFVSDGSTGLLVIDISNPGAPALVGTCDTPYFARGVCVSGDHAYIADAGDGLQVIDISDPTAPVLVGGWDTYYFARGGICVSGDLVFLADSGGGLEILDVTDPTTPVLVGNYDTLYQAFDVEVAGDHAYVTDLTDGLLVIDVTNPAAPVLAGAYDTPSFSAFGVCVAGDLAFVTDTENGLHVLDISDPTAPALLGHCVTAVSAYDVYVSGDRAFVADQEAGVVVIDVSDPTAPTELYVYDTLGDAQEIVVWGDYAYVADGNALEALLVSQGQVDVDHNVGQSLAVDAGSDPILRARLSSTQTSGVSWELSADAGAHWDHVTAGIGWAALSYPGADLLWRTTHSWAPDGNPTVSDLTLEWLTPFSPILSIADIAPDQGGRVRLRLLRSGLDFADEPDEPIAAYNILRRVDDPALCRSLIEKAGSPEGTVSPARDGLPVVTWNERRFTVGGTPDAKGSLPDGVWEIVGNFAALQQDTYLYEAATLADSTAEGIPYAVFCVTAHTTTPSIWYASPPDSGYSVDNLAPGVPAGIVAAYAPDAVTLDWEDAWEEDFQYYRVYRGEDPGFTPSPETLVHETAASAWVDEGADPWGHCYKITALDHAGNESGAGAPESVTGVRENDVPARTALLGAVPNPFNPSTEVHFTLAAAGRVRLTVHDLAGRLVRTLMDGQLAAGRRQVGWNGCDDAGRQVSSGVYICLLEAADHRETMRMVLVK
jgi:hypothetical protein